VVAALVVRLPFCPSPVALPVLFRLWRGKGAASQVRLAADLLELLARTFPGRDVHGTGDAAFHGGPLAVRGTTWTTRLPWNAALHGTKPEPTASSSSSRRRLPWNRSTFPVVVGDRGAVSRWAIPLSRQIPSGPRASPEPGHTGREYRTTRISALRQ
jgi:hypothetical protein